MRIEKFVCDECKKEFKVKDRKIYICDIATMDMNAQFSSTVHTTKEVCSKECLVKFVGKI